MATANVSTTSPGTTPFTVNVTACNLLTDLTVKDFQVFVNGTINCEGSACTNWTKTTSTQLTYSGSVIANGTSIQIRRKTPNVVIQTITYAERFSSDLWNRELDRIIRWREEADLNSVGAGSTITLAVPLDTAYPTGWDGDTIQPPTRNAVYDALQLFAPLASPALTGTPTAPTAADGTSTTQLATTAFAATRVANALANSPALGGNPTATTQAANTNNTRVATTAFVEQEIQGALKGTNTAAGSILQGMKFKNAVMNGRFNVWQRNTSFTIAGSGVFVSTKVADRWKFDMQPDGGTTAAVVVSRQAHTTGQTDVPYEPDYFIRIANSTAGTSLGANSYTILTEQIESVRTLAGQTITLSFYARSTIGSKTLGIELNQVFGTGGSPSAFVTGIGSQTFTLTSTFTKYTAVINVPSISGKTIGTNNDDNLTLLFWLQSSSGFSARAGGTFGWQGTGNIDISDVQIEIGGISTPIEARDFGLEKLLCMRYYQKSYQYNVFAGASTTAGMTQWQTGSSNVNQQSLYTRYPVELRAVPTVTLYDTVGNSGKVYRGGDNAAATVITNSTTTLLVGANAGANTDVVAYHYTADAEY